MKWLVLTALALALSGCGRHGSNDAPPLTFEESVDTSGVSKGAPILTRIEPYRMANGVLRIRGVWDVPDGTRLQVSVIDKRSNETIGRWQMTVEQHHFDSPPIIGRMGPLPKGLYRLEYLAHFNQAWQPANVLDATDQGRRLRGPGVTRTQQGQGAFFLAEERRL